MEVKKAIEELGAQCEEFQLMLEAARDWYASTDLSPEQWVELYRRAILLGDGAVCLKVRLEDSLRKPGGIDMVPGVVKP